MKDSTIPKHVGFILDGNRRWAKANSLPLLEGHRQGMETFKDVSLAAFDKGVRYISAYVFSTENWNRTKEEVSYLMGLVIKAVEKHLDTFHRAGIKIVVLGRRQGLDKSVLKALDRTIEKTKNNTKGTLALCFNYGGKEEIADAVKALTGVKKEITAENIEHYLYEPDIPPLDLVVRTSGEQRLSGFMLWRAAYAEFFFTETLWPDFTTTELDQILSEYSSRQRRFGV